MELTDKVLGKERVFIIAELSANHNNDLELALKTIEAMAAAGADAVKVQTFKPESLTLNVDNEYFGPRKEGLWKGYTPYELFREAMMPWEWQPKLKKAAENAGLLFFSSPFDREAVDFLEDLDVPAYKLASLEITDLPLIAYMARKNKPLIISTGLAGLEDIDAALSTCRNAGNDKLALLKCTSEYPAPVEAANLATIPNMKETFGVPVGISDHTMGNTVPLVAVALGARIVEKHFILDRNLGGPDSAFSMEPQEFADMVKGVREAEKAVGAINYAVSDKGRGRRRSLFVCKDIKAGELFTAENIRSIRPGQGLHPRYLEDVLGKKANADLPAGIPLRLDHVQWS